jgi:CheY-like chemotaxis protein
MMRRNFSMLGQEEPSGEERSTVKTILVVEDDADVGEFFVQALQQETPYQSILATDGFQALKIVQSVKPNLFVLDYLLPHMNGIELYDHLHATKGLEEIPALFMSANAPSGELERRRVYFLKKPVDLEELLQKIDELLAE